MNAQLSNIIDRLLQNEKKINIVKIAVGELIPFREEQLQSQWRELTQGTSLSLSALNIRMIRAEQQCMVCFQKYHPEDQETRCPYCKSVGAKILAGEEFHLESIEDENE